MGKRQNETSQLSKEELHALELCDSGDAPDQGPRRASQEVLQRRKIIRVSNKWKNKHGIRPPTTAMPTPSATAPTSTPTNANSSNPFANTSFASTVNKPSSTTKLASNVNPFATVSFATTPVNASKPFGFTSKGPVATSTKKPRQAPGIMTGGSSSTVTNSFSSALAKSGTTTTTQTTDDAEKKALLPLRPGAKENEVIPLDEKTKLNLMVLRMAQKEGVNNPISDYTCWLKNYTAKMENTLGGKNGDDSYNATSKETKPSTFSFAPGSTSTPKASESSSNGNASSTSTPTFSFSSAPSPINEPKKFTGFDFKPPTTSAASSSSPAATSASKDDATTSEANNNDDGQSENLGAAEVNEDEEELYSCRARFTKMIDEGGTKKWKQGFSIGNLRLYRNKKDGTGKLVVRNEVAGLVILNLGIPKGNKFQRAIANKKKDVGSLTFMSVEKAEEGTTMFMIQAKNQYMDPLEMHLKSIAES